MAGKRNLGFDVARSLAMVYIVGVLHLSGYTEYAVTGNSACVSFIWSTLGVFTFLSGFLLASRYKFDSVRSIIQFYKKRVVRFYPLFFISSLLLLLIHFNSWQETWKGLLGISPFWKPQQHTLWYIATLIFLYLVTPVLCKGNKKIIEKGLNFILILAIPLLINYFFHSVDPRFFYYYIVYFLGIVCAQDFPLTTQKLINSPYTLALFLMYIPALCYLAGHENRVVMMGLGYLGVPIVLNVSSLAAYKFGKSRIFCTAITFISYGSMCAYLYHRELYWLFLKIWTPANSFLELAYLFFIVFPIILFVSYYIQKRYDGLFSRKGEKGK